MLREGERPDGRDSQRSGAEMGDGRSGLLPRPIAPINRARLVSPIYGYPTPLRFGDGVADRRAEKQICI